MGLLLLHLFLFSSQVHASPYDLESPLARDRRSLRMDMGSASDAANGLVRMSLEKEKIPPLQDLVAQAVTGVSGVNEHAGSLYGQCRDALATMDKTMKGDYQNTSPEKALGYASGSLAEQKNLLEKMSLDVQNLKSNNSASIQSVTEGTITPNLDSAIRTLADAETKIQTMKDAFELMRARLLRAGSLWEDIRKAFKDVADNASALQSSALEARASIDALGSDPEAPRRAKAVQAISQLSDLMGALYLSSDVLYHRTEDFGPAWTEFQKGRDGFYDTNTAVLSDLQDAAASLDKARRAIVQAQSIQKN